MTRARHRRRLAWSALVMAAAALIGARWAWRARKVRWAPPAGRMHDAALAVRVLGEPGDPPVVLLHGLLGSNLYWGAAYDALGRDSFLIAPDLLGFGASRDRPAEAYDADAQARAILATLDDLRVERPAVVAGHSLGGLVALRLAALAPERVRAVVAFAPPLFPSRQAARRRISDLDPMGGFFVFDTPASRRLCHWHERHPAAATALTRLLRPELPAPLARAAVEHTWDSYVGSLEGVVLRAAGERWIDTVAAPLHVVAGDEDGILDLPYLESLLGADADRTLVRVPGAGHDLPLADPERCIEEIRRRLDSGGGSERMDQ